MGCDVLQRRHRKLRVGDLKDRICLQRRAISEPNFGATDFGENFTRETRVWAKVETSTGKSFFDGVNPDVPVTHVVGIRYDKDVTTETWILLLDGRRLNILDVQDLEERHEWMILRCTDRGLDTKEASAA